MPDVLEPVFLPDPVNRAHPLNRGRVSWWLALPGLDGGRQLFDLMGLNHGTLTNGPAWRGTTRPGGYGHISTDGVSSVVDAGHIAALDGATRASYSAWAYRSSTGTTVGLGRWHPTNEDQFSWIWYTDGVLYNAVGLGAALGGSYTVGPLVGIGWHLITTVFDGSLVGDTNRLKTYVDGVLLPTTLGGGNPVPASLATSPGSHWTFGEDSSGRFSAGSYDDASIWTRALSPDEVRADYDESRAGYPGALNRLGSSSVVLPTVSAATTFAFAATAAGSTLAASFTASAPAAAAVAFAATAAGSTLAATFTASAPGVTAVAFAATAAAATLAATVTASAPAATTVAFATATANATLASHWKNGAIAPTLKEEVVAALLASDELAAIVGGRIYPEWLPQTASLPALSYGYTTGRHDMVLAGAAGMRSATMSFEVRSHRHGDVEDVREVLRLMFQGYIGMLGTARICFAQLENENDGYDPPFAASDLGTHVKTFDFRFKTTETIPSF